MTHRRTGSPLPTSLLDLPMDMMRNDKNLYIIIYIYMLSWCNKNCLLTIIIIIISHRSLNKQSKHWEREHILPNSLALPFSTEKVFIDPNTLSDLWIYPIYISYDLWIYLYENTCIYIYVNIIIYIYIYIIYHIITYICIYTILCIYYNIYIYMYTFINTIVLVM